MEISVGEIITICGGASTIIAGIVGYVAQRLANKQNERWRLTTESELKRLENELSEKSSFLANLIDVQKSSYNFSQDKRISSIEKVWNNLEKVKQKISPTVEFIYNSITAEEINDLNKEDLSESGRLISRQLRNINYNDFFLESNNFTRVIFSERPFMGENLWLMITLYNKFLERIMYLTQSGQANSTIKHWRHDSAIMEMLKYNFPSEQIVAISKVDVGSYDMICYIFEEKIIDQINDVLSGKVASNNSLEHIKLIKNLITKIST